MKKVFNLLGITAFFAVVGFAMIACSNGSTGGGPGKSDSPTTGGPTISTGGEGTPGLAYELINNGTAYRVRKGTVTGGKVVIPAYYNGTTRRGNMSRSAEEEDGLPVKEIGSADDDENNGAFGGTDITDIEIPETVELIGPGAFANTNITSIEIPEGVTSIGQSTFYGCRGFTSITIPASLEKIYPTTFLGCHNLTSIIVAEGNPNYTGEDGILYDIIGGIDDWELFDKGNKQLHSYPSASGSVTIPAGVTSIGIYAFSYNTSLSAITIPEGVTSIGVYAFVACTSLSAITIPSSVTSIGNGAFSGCTSLSAITIPSSVTSIGNYTFEGCISLVSITVDADNPNYSSQDGILYDKAKTVFIKVPEAISGSITIPSSITYIGGNAFENCTSLSAITIPLSVTSIHSHAFAGCTSLSTITIPSSVTSIRDGAFYGCTSLSSITIPLSVKSISYAFLDWTSSQTIYVEGYASQAAADAAWGKYWRYDCNAVIKYWNGSSYQ